MRTTILRQYTTVVCIWALVVGPTVLPGCGGAPVGGGGGGGGGGDETIAPPPVKVDDATERLNKALIDVYGALYEAVEIGASATQENSSDIGRGFDAVVLEGVRAGVAGMAAAPDALASQDTNLTSAKNGPQSAVILAAAGLAI